MSLKFISLILIILLSFFLTNDLLNDGLLSKESHTKESPSITRINSIKNLIQFDQSSPIYINGNGELNVFPGSGTSQDPFRIEKLNITSTSGYLIYISNTNSFLRILIGLEEDQRVFPCPMLKIV